MEFTMSGVSAEFPEYPPTTLPDPLTGWPHDATPEELEAEAHANDKPHYHVWNQYGDAPIATCTSYREACREAAAEARVWRDDLHAYVRGSARRGYTIQWEKDSMGSWSLWIEKCNERPCQLNEDY